MSEAPDRVGDDELHAFVDAQIDPARLPAVLAWLQANPADTARVLHWQAQRTQLRQMARAVELDQTPAALTKVVMDAGAGARRRAIWQQAAAVLLLVAAGVAGGRYWGRGESPEPIGVSAPAPSFARDAAVAHAVFVPERRHPVEVAASDETHLVQWLSRRLGVPLKAPSLARNGYQLLGGRLLPGDGAPRAQFMYEDARGTRVTLYVAVFAPGRAPAATAFRSLRVGGEETFYWTEERFGYALSADIDGPDLQALAREVHAQLER
jgi:anti-sigma factor RsiW